MAKIEPKAEAAVETTTVEPTDLSKILERIDRLEKENKELKDKDVNVHTKGKKRYK